MLTEKETWSYMANAFETHSDDEELICLGICWAVDELYHRGEVSEDVRNTIVDKAMAEVDLNKIYLAPCNCPEGDAIRAKFCREQAALLEKDGE